MAVYQVFSRPVRARNCALCGTHLPAATPRPHRLCRACWSYAPYSRAIVRFLESSRRLP